MKKETFFGTLTGAVVGTIATLAVVNFKPEVAEYAKDKYEECKDKVKSVFSKKESKPTEAKPETPKNEEETKK